MKNKLNIVGTSLGNIEDITIRAFRYIFESDVILAEDTRVFLKMKSILKERYSETLATLKIDITKFQDIKSYREQNHDRIISWVIEKLQNENIIISLFSDAGMPAISDPGYELIRDVVVSGFEIDVIPSGTADVSALILSGLPTDRYTFIGFLPRKPSKIEDLLNSFLNDNSTLIVYESPFRVVKTLEVIKARLGDDIIVAAVSEITKKFQNVTRGKIGEVIEQLKTHSLKGEWVICLRKV
jgi:16S rRNA (cytidine1402-2'-O)-methyltransferase